MRTKACTWLATAVNLLAGTQKYIYSPMRKCCSSSRKLASTVYCSRAQMTAHRNNVQVMKHQHCTITCKLCRSTVRTLVSKRAE
jgi:hypothetical protein